MHPATQLSAPAQAGNTAVTQLSNYIKAFGSRITVEGKTFDVQGIRTDGHIAVGTFKTARGSYLGTLRTGSSVIGRKSAEVWSIIAPKRELARFAVHGAQIVPLFRS